MIFFPRFPPSESAVASIVSVLVQPLEMIRCSGSTRWGRKIVSVLVQPLEMIRCSGSTRWGRKMSKCKKQGPCAGSPKRARDVNKR